MNHTTPRSCAPSVLASAVVVLAATLIAGCDKAKEEPVGATATVVMPDEPAPMDSSSSSATAPTVASTGGAAPVVANGDPPMGITAGNSGPPTGGTVSVIPNPAPAPTATAAPPTAAAPESPLDATALPPAITASRAGGAGAIGPSASGPADDQPLAVPPGTKN